MDTVSVVVAGATGYAGQELLRRLARHPHARVSAALAGTSADGPRRLPALARVWDGEVRPFDLEAFSGAGAAFLALPEATSAAVAPALVASGTRVFDLSGAFRLRDAVQRRRWYPATPECLPPTAYGLTELHRDSVRSASLVACPGCYPTATLLAAAPLAAAGILDPDADLVIDAKSGISGAGKGPSERTHFSENHASVAAYNVFAHRHAAEMEQELDRAVTFVPHLVPLDRGILATLYGRLAPDCTADDVGEAFERAYRDAPFVRLTGDSLPEIKHVAYTNFCDIGWCVEPGGRRLVVVSVIDNLLKGAAGQAVQNFNVAFGFDEGAGIW
jgi:N-acetyl-gamma-glutamyl-phosphate reductase